MVTDPAVIGSRGDAPRPDSFQGSAGALSGWSQLLTVDGAQHLAEIEARVAAGETFATENSRLRAAGVNGDEVAALLTQVKLRRGARTKFGDAAGSMLFTPAGLEQASRSVVSAQHAHRFADAGLSRVADLGCGVGSESIALLLAGVNVLAVEKEPFTAQLAEHNLKVCSVGLSVSFEVLTADATAVRLDEVEGAFLDPARRTSGHSDTRRLTDPDDYSPSLGFAFDLAKHMPTGLKLGPGFDRGLIPDEAEAQWVSVDGQVVEMGLWFGALARRGVKRSALVMSDGNAHDLSAEADAADAATRPLGDYLYEPDGAVIRARLIGKLADQLDAGMVSEGIAYLTGDRLEATPFARAFRIRELLPVGEKQLRRALEERGIGRLEIKKRGVDVDPAALRTRLRLKGQYSATLILTRVGGRHTAILADRV